MVEFTSGPSIPGTESFMEKTKERIKMMGISHNSDHDLGIIL